MAHKKQRIKERKKVEQQQRKQQQYLIGGAVGLVLIAIALFFILRPDPRSQLNPDLDLSSIPENSVTFASQGQEHIEVGAVHLVYNSNPPTSGPHTTPIRLGAYTTQYPDENMIHNLEHGHIWLSYRDADDTEAIQLLTGLQQSYPDRVIMTYRPENDTRVALAAWTRLLSLDELDSEQIEAFIIRFNNQAPESVLGN
jgi:hypothetical protein